MLPKKKNKNRIVLNLVICFILLALSVLIIWFRQRIVDQISIWQFKPTAEITALASRLELNTEGKFYFYASQPELESATNFNQSCSRIENSTSILGCYSNSRIYVYNVTDARLDGIREVTAAHEMLHAVYQRLDSGEKDKIAILLEAEYKKLTSDANFVDLIEFYDRTEPGERYNELFSVIGTTVPNIDPALEAYYDRYFSNRQAIVKYNSEYNGVFKDLSDRAAALAVTLNTLSETIPANSAKYNADVKTLNDDIDIFNKKANNGDFESLAQFYSERATIEARVAAINVTRQSINADIDSYNSTLADYNSIALQSQQLYNSIDSTLVNAESIQ
jgi:hypothetical protein